MLGRVRQARTVAASIPAAVAHVAALREARARTLLGDVGLDAASLDEEARVPGEINAAVWREAVRRTGDARFGLALAAAQDAGAAYGLVGYLGMTSRTAGEAVERSVRYHRILKDGTDTRLSSTGGAVTIEESFDPPDDPAFVAMAECAAATHVLLLRRWTGAEVRPLEVRFGHGRPASLAPYEGVFDCPVRFDQPRTAVVFRRETMDLGLHTTQPELASFLEGLARRRAEKLPKDDIVSLVREVVRAGLPEGDPGLPRVARTLGVSPRTLQRRLLDHGFDYLRLVDEIRHGEALSLINAPEVPLAEIGYRLGYSDAKAFRRAFRRWTGVSPAEMRRGKDGAAARDEREEGEEAFEAA
jgi:AraC-like DNA-binding protein